MINFYIIRILCDIKIELFFILYYCIMEAVAEAQDEQEIAVIPRFNEENKPFEALLEDFIKFVVGKITQIKSKSDTRGPYYFYNIIVRIGRCCYLSIANNYSNPNSYSHDTYGIKSNDLIVHYMKKMKIKDDTNTIDYIELEKDDGAHNIIFREHTDTNVDITNMVSKYFNKSAFISACTYCDYDNDDNVVVVFSFANANVAMRAEGRDVDMEINLFPANVIEFKYESRYSKDLIEQTDLKQDESHQQTDEKMDRMIETETFILFIEEMIALDLFKNVRKTLQVRPAVECKEY